MGIRRGRDIIFETLRNEGIRYVFGNPGTTELPLIDGFVEHPDVEYRMALHEDIAVGMAMGYARATGKVGVANLHVAPGLTHGLSNMYNAMRAGTPILVTAGQQHSRYLLHEPILWGDLVGLARPVTKWAYEPHSVEELQIALPRALKEAATPPGGPVFLSLPPDVLWEETDRPALPVAHIGARTLADPAELRRAAERLRTAERPLIIAGDGVGQAGAQTALVDLAEWLGAGVVAEPLSTEVNFPTNHPLFLGPLVYRPEIIRGILEGVDCLLLCGFTAQGPLPVYNGQPLFPPEVRLLYVHSSAHEIAKIYPGEACVWGDVKRSLEALLESLRSGDAPAAETRARREAVVRERVAARRERARREAEAAWNAQPISALRLMAELARAMADLPRLRGCRPEEAIIVSEAITNTAALQAQVDRTLPGTWIAGKGGGLGHSMGTALGVQVALPQRVVINPIGDGSFLYYPQALWTAAHYRLPVFFLVINNTSYRILKQGMVGLGGAAARRGVFTGLDIVDPNVDFAGMARTYGVRGTRVEQPDQLGDALRDGLSGEGAALLEVVVDRSL